MQFKVHNFMLSEFHHNLKTHLQKEKIQCIQQTALCQALGQLRWVRPALC